MLYISNNMYTSFNKVQSNRLRCILFSDRHQDYVSDPFLDEYKFDV